MLIIIQKNVLIRKTYILKMLLLDDVELWPVSKRVLMEAIKNSKSILLRH